MTLNELLKVWTPSNEVNVHFNDDTMEDEIEVMELCDLVELATNENPNVVNLDTTDTYENLFLRDRQWN